MRLKLLQFWNGISPADSRRAALLMLLAWVCKAFWVRVAFFQNVGEVLTKNTALAFRARAEASCSRYLPGMSKGWSHILPLQCCILTPCPLEIRQPALTRWRFGSANLEWESRAETRLRTLPSHLFQEHVSTLADDSCVLKAAYIINRDLWLVTIEE